MTRMGVGSVGFVREEDRRICGGGPKVMLNSKEEVMCVEERSLSRRKNENFSEEGEDVIVEIERESTTTFIAKVLPFVLKGVTMLKVFYEVEAKAHWLTFHYYYRVSMISGIVLYSTIVW
ncbi:unnamed protein product [Dovyalis caffra]|uniref:Uncharacterized protein n=1 Tax=Dovyalis caffra TaxID=77055 RepID=A0AAV1S575_9ROSI|nr:unnamed protein product [Dovyalis caffra]